MNKHRRLRIVVEGWRFIAHTYAIVNCWQLLELMKRPRLELHHVDRELGLDHGRRPALTRGLFLPEEEQRLARLAPPPAGIDTDLTFRLTAHFDFSASSSRRTAVFAATEWGQIAHRKLKRLPVVGGR